MANLALTCLLFFLLRRRSCPFRTRNFFCASDVGLAAQRRRRGPATLLRRGRAASRTRRAGSGLVVLPRLVAEYARQVQVQRAAERRDPEATTDRQHLARACAPAWSKYHPWQCLSSALTPPLSGLALPGSGRPTGRPAAASGARASRLRSRRFRNRLWPCRHEHRPQPAPLLPQPLPQARHRPLLATASTHVSWRLALL